jgi:hypothetical protein
VQAALLCCQPLSTYRNSISSISKIYSVYFLWYNEPSRLRVSLRGNTQIFSLEHIANIDQKSVTNSFKIKLVRDQLSLVTVNISPHTLFGKQVKADGSVIIGHFNDRSNGSIRAHGRAAKQFGTSNFTTDPDRVLILTYNKGRECPKSLSMIYERISMMSHSHIGKFINHDHYALVGRIVKNGIYNDDQCRKYYFNGDIFCSTAISQKLIQSQDKNVVATGPGLYYVKAHDYWIIGQFQDDYAIGQCQVFYANNDVLSGLLQFNVPEGECQIKYAEPNICNGGDYYVGSFSGGVKHGIGVTAIFGRKYSQLWEKGILREMFAHL